MRTVPVVAAAVWLVGGLGASPFAGLDQAPGVYVTVDGYGITIRQSAVGWDFLLPDGSKAEWKRKKGHGYGQAPHVKISCRAEGGYSPREALRAVWTVPRPAGMPKGLKSDQRVYWKYLWPWTHHGGLDLALSAIVRGEGVVFSETPDKTDRLELQMETLHQPSKKTGPMLVGLLDFTVSVEMGFQVDPGTAAAAQLLTRHCTAAE